MISTDEDFYHLTPYMDCYKPMLEEVKEVIEMTYKNNQSAYIRL